MKVLSVCRGLFFPITYQSISLKHPESSEAFKSELEVKLAYEGKCIFLTIWEVNRQINLWLLTTDICVSNVTAGGKHHHGSRSCNTLTKFRFHSTSNIHMQLPSLQRNPTVEAEQTVHNTQGRETAARPLSIPACETANASTRPDVSTPLSASPVHASPLSFNFYFSLYFRRLLLQGCIFIHIRTWVNTSVKCVFL